MAVNIGPRIGIDGEAEYRKQLQQIIQTTKTLDSEMKKVESSFDETTSAEEKAAAKSEVLRKEIDNQKEKVRLLQEMLGKSADKYGENDTKTLKWRQAVNEATTQLNKMEGELKDTNKNMDNVGDATKDAGNAMDDASGKASVFGDTLMANLASKAITAGLDAIVTGIKNISGAMVDGVKDAAAYADEVLTMSTVTGISTDKLQEYKYMSELVDVSVDTITGSMTKLTRGMASARDGSDKYVDAFKRLGVSVTDGNGALRDNEEVFAESIAALGKMTNETERDALAMEIFGKSAQDLNPLIAAGEDKLKGFTDAAHESGYVLSEEQLGALGEVDDAFQTFDVTVKGIKNQLAVGLAPAVTSVAGVFQDWAASVDWDAVGDKIANMGQRAVEFVEAVDWESAFGLISDGAESLWDTIEGFDFEGTAKLVGDLATGVINVGTWMLENGETIASVVGAIAGVMAGMQIASFVGSLGLLAGGPLAAIPIALGAIVGAGVLVVENWDTIKETAAGWAENIGAFFDGAAEKAAEIGGQIAESWNGMKENINTAITDATELQSNKLAEMQQAYDDCGGGVSGAVGAMMSGVKTDIDSGLTFVNDLTGGKLDGVIASFDGMYDNVSHGVTDWIGGVEDKIKDGLGSAKDWIDDKLGAIGDKFSEIWNGARDTVSGAIDAIKGFLDFNWELPNLPLPHFSVSGSFGWSWDGGIELPSIDVEWYKRAYTTPVLLNSPTIFGYNAGSLLGGGDGNGAEVVSGAGKLMAMMKDAVSSVVNNTRTTNMGGLTINVYPSAGMDEEALAEKVAELIQDDIDRKDAVFA